MIGAIGLMALCALYLISYDRVLGTAEGSKTGMAFYMAVAVFLAFVFVIVAGMWFMHLRGVL